MFLGFLLPLWLGFLIFDLLRRLKLTSDWREAFLIEAMILGVAIAASTEFLNLFHALTTWCVLGWWALVCLSLNYYRLRLPQAEPLKIGISIRAFYRETSWDGLLMLLVMVIFALTLFAISFCATPNNYDSMTYHLGRVAHWQQNQSIAFYGTNIPRQNYSPPWAEWTMLHLTLLQGDDRLVNLVQWISYAGCLVGISLITELLGGTRREGIMAAFFVATLSGALFEATSTQNDLVMSFWMICTLYGCLRLTGSPDWPGTLIFGASLGMAMLTKTVTMIFAAPLCLWAGWALIRPGPRKSVPQLAVITLIVLSLNLGHYTRNYIATGHVLGADEHSVGAARFTNDSHGPGAIFSNIVRNLSLHANLFHEKTVPEQAVIDLHRALGLDPQDPRTTFNHTKYSIWEGGEDGTPMPLHLVVIAVAFMVLIGKRNRFTSLPFFLALTVLTGAFLFCFVLKWQPFHARLHLPLFILSAPLVALVLDRVFWRGLTLPILILFLLMSVSDVFWYMPRAALGPISVFVTSSDFQQLWRQPQLVKPYFEALQLLDQNKVQDVGLIWKEDDWEYPLLNADRVPVPWRVDHVLIENAYAPLETTNVPDALLCTRPGFGDTITVHGQGYKLARAYVQGPAQDLVLSIYFPENVTVSEPR